MGGEQQYSQLPHAIETGIRSGRVGLRGSCATLPKSLSEKSEIYAPFFHIRYRYFKRWSRNSANPRKGIPGNLCSAHDPNPGWNTAGHAVQIRSRS